MPTFLTLTIGTIIVVAALLTVTRRNPIHAVLSMLVSLCGIAVLMLGLHAPFLAAMQILLYGGAIMILFTFVIMLLTLREEEMGPEPPQTTKRHIGVSASPDRPAFCWSRTALASTNTVDRQNT